MYREPRALNNVWDDRVKVRAGTLGSAAIPTKIRIERIQLPVVFASLDHRLIALSL